MLASPEVLVVDDSLERPAIVQALKAAGYRVTSAGTFEQATAIMAHTPPDVLITEVRLGAFNGLHLIIRSRAYRANTVAVIHTAYPDPVLEAEARLLDADYFERPVDEPALLSIIAQRLGQRPERRKSSRRQVHGGYKVNLLGASADLIDVSADGLCVKLNGDELKSPLEVRFPSLDLSIDGRIVWAQHPSPDKDSFLCGIQVTRTNRRGTRAWKRVTREI